MLMQRGSKFSGDHINVVHTDCSFGFFEYSDNLFQKKSVKKRGSYLEKSLCFLIMIIPRSFQEFDRASPRLYTRARTHTLHLSLTVRVLAHERVRVCVFWVMSVKRARKHTPPPQLK